MMRIHFSISRSTCARNSSVVLPIGWNARSSKLAPNAALFTALAEMRCSLSTIAAGEVDAGADAGRREGQLARIGLGERDELLGGLERRRGVHAQHQLRSRQQ